MIQKNHINSLIVGISKLLMKQGKVVSPRDQKTLELTNLQVCLTNPKHSICTLKSRRLSRVYLNAELSWYRSGDMNIAGIKDYSSMWEKLADNQGYVNSNYGYWAKHHIVEHTHTQFEWCLKSLVKDINTRRAVINYNQTDHKVDDVKDFPCTMYQQFYVRDNKLDSSVCMRSNDLIYGFCYDVPYFTLLQKELAQKLDMSVGKYYHYTTSMHVYERHFSMLEQIIKEEY